MRGKSIREKLTQVGPPPGLSPWLNNVVVLLRCGDITKVEFKRRLDDLRSQVRELHKTSSKESMDQETYLAAQEYYDVAKQALESYLAGLSSLESWADTGTQQLIDVARLEFTKADRLSYETMILGFEAQESFKEIDEEFMRSQNIDIEGIG